MQGDGDLSSLLCAGGIGFDSFEVSTNILVPQPPRPHNSVSHSMTSAKKFEIILSFEVHAGYATQCTFGTLHPPLMSHSPVFRYIPRRSTST